MICIRTALSMFNHTLSRSASGRDAHYRSPCRKGKLIMTLERTSIFALAIFLYIFSGVALGQKPIIPVSQIPVSALATAVKVGIPIKAASVKPAASGISINGVQGYSFCSADATASYLDPCKVSAVSLSTAPTLKVPVSGYKLALGSGSLTPTPISGPSHMLEVHAVTNIPAPPALVVAISAASGTAPAGSGNSVVSSPASKASKAKDVQPRPAAK